MKDNKYKIVAIVGSISKNSNTRKSLKLAVNEIEKHENFTVEIIDPRYFDLPTPGSGIMNESRKRLQEIVAEADGAILATPEYNGSFSSIIKLIIENLGYPSELSEKPISLLGIASGDMGQENLLKLFVEFVLTLADTFFRMQHQLLMLAKNLILRAIVLMNKQIGELEELGLH